MRDPMPVARLQLSSERELRRRLRCGAPFVVAGGASGWPAARWTPSLLRAKAGACKVLTHRSDTAYFGLDEANGGPKLQEEEMTLEAFVALAAEPERHAIRYYLQRASIPDRLPPLLADLRVPAGVPLEKIYLVNLWFGPADNVTRLHYDVPNNYLVQLYGRKRIVLFAPRDSARVYPFRTKAYNMSQVDIDHADLARFPKLAGAQPYEAEIGPSDMLYIPPYWWHQVYSLELGISANYWWMPRPRQYLAPQLPDVFLDVARVLKQRFLSRPPVLAIPRQ